MASYDSGSNFMIRHAIRSQRRLLLPQANGTVPEKGSSPTSQLACLLLGLAVFGVWGCSPAPSPDHGKGGAPNQRSEFHLLVVDDPALAEAIGGLKAEWKARSGTSLSVEQHTAEELLSAAALPAGVDAVIYPSQLLGTLVTRDWLAPLPGAYASNPDLAWPDLFELLQVSEASWGQVPYAAPFGSPVLTCYYRPDLFERFHKRPPRTWKEYAELAQFFARRENLGDAIPSADAAWYGCAEPREGDWSARLLLARAAAYARHRDHYSTLFRIDTMAPLIAGPPFVRALEELVAAARLAPAGTLPLDPAGARREFLAGHAAMTLSWPHRDADTAGEPPPIAFVELPGSDEVYDIATGRWEQRTVEDGKQVTLLGVAGRLGSLTGSGGQGDQALQLLAWLSGKEWGTKISSASPATTLYRRSQMPVPQPWLDQGTDSEASQQYADSVRDSLSRHAYLSMLRIPGGEKYLRVLGAAVHDALEEKKSPAEALASAATQWSEITGQLGVAAQATAYRKSLGVDP